jgi:Nif-specific regulatory protein
MEDPVQLLSDIVEMLNSDGARPLNLNPATGRISEGLGFSRSFIILHQPQLDGFSAVASSGFTPAEFRKLDSAASGEVFATTFNGRNEDHHRISIHDHPELAFLSRDTGPCELFLVPIRNGRKTVGILGGVRSGGNVDREAVRMLELIAGIVAQGLRAELAVLTEREKLREENLHLKQELKEKYDFSHIIGNSNAIRSVYEQVTQVARSNATTLLRGESGTGKEMIANAIHYNSLRSKGPFIKLNCAALPDTLIESELFGHERGAFTGADRMKRGRFELADGGTLFLDEIGDLPSQTQIKLLRVLQEREFERLGGTSTIRSNIRLIAATNRDLEKLIADGTFREDLYYRLNVFAIHLPPLRERKSDILLLAEHFLEKFESEHGKRIRRISTPAIDMLMSYHFPGNVRELENAIERAVLACDSNVIHGHHLPPTLQTAEVSGTVTSLSLASAVEAFERGLIQDALKSTRGNIAKAARMLDSTERILGYKIKNFGIVPSRFRE